MPTAAQTPEDYISQLPEDRRIAIEKLREISRDNLPDGFTETISYGMIAYVVPHQVYPNGYHCNPKEPLPFLSFASQKNSVNLYHMMLYADKNLHDWFVAEYPKHAKSKLDMGKSCVRFKKMDDIPYGLIGELLTKVSVADWIARFEEALKK